MYSRPVTFLDPGEDLLSAIVETFSFSGLALEHIVLLQMATEKSYHGHFVDIVDSSLRIDNNSVIRVMLVEVCTIIYKGHNCVRVLQLYPYTESVPENNGP